MTDNAKTVRYGYDDEDAMFVDMSKKDEHGQGEEMTVVDVVNQLNAYEARVEALERVRKAADAYLVAEPAQHPCDWDCTQEEGEALQIAGGELLAALTSTLDHVETLERTLRHIYELGHNNDCLFCGLKDKAALAAAGEVKETDAEKELRLAHKVLLTEEERRWMAHHTR
jgi:hypothetical protein